MDVSAAKLIGAGLATIALAGVGVGIGNIFGSFVQGALRNPEAAPRVFGNVLLGFALTEAVALFALVIAFMIKPRFGRPAGEWPRPSQELEHVLIWSHDWGCLGSGVLPSSGSWRAGGRTCHGDARRTGARDDRGPAAGPGRRRQHRAALRGPAVELAGAGAGVGYVRTDSSANRRRCTT